MQLGPDRNLNCLTLPKEFFKIVDLEKKSVDKKNAKLPSMQRVKMQPYFLKQKTFSNIVPPVGSLKLHTLSLFIF